MQSPQGIWTYDTEENDITKAFNLLGDRLSVKESLNILLSGDKPGFTASNGQSYAVKENPDLFFIDYIPRVYNFIGQVKEVKTLNEVPK